MTTNNLTLTKIGGLISLQDKGRAHVQHLGFGASGASDEYAYLSANHALGNTLGAATLELFIFTEISFKVNADCTLFISGADSRATVNQLAVSHWKPLFLKQGDELFLHQPRQGKITYIAVQGGFTGKQWLNSVSQNVNEKSLETSAKLIVGDNIAWTKTSHHKTPKASPNSTVHKQRHEYPWHNFYSFSAENSSKNTNITLRFIPSALFLSFPLHQQNKLLQQTYSIKPESNRMGYRLSSAKAIDDIKQEKQLSKPVCFGTIQLPPDGQPIVLMKDRQTIGGYPVLGVVMQTDLFRLSQCHAGDQVTFCFTSLTFAQSQLKAFYDRFNDKLVKDQ